LAKNSETEMSRCWDASSSAVAPRVTRAAFDFGAAFARALGPAFALPPDFAFARDLARDFAPPDEGGAEVLHGVRLLAEDRQQHDLADVVKEADQEGLLAIDHDVGGDGARDGPDRESLAPDLVGEPGQALDAHDAAADGFVQYRIAHGYGIACVNLDISRCTTGVQVGREDNFSFSGRDFAGVVIERRRKAKLNHGGLTILKMSIFP